MLCGAIKLNKKSLCDFSYIYIKIVNYTFSAIIYYSFHFVCVVQVSFILSSAILIEFLRLYLKNAI